MKHLLLVVLCLSWIGFAHAVDPDEVAAQAIPDIKDLPRLRAGLPPGTIAWATPDQLHPTQPQTGKREVQRKAEKLKDLLRANGGKFSRKLYEYVYQKRLIPVYVAKTPESDSRYGKEEILGYATDRTHGSNAQSQVIKDIYGKAGLSQVIYDKDGRPLNFILVKVMEDDTYMSEKEFKKYMVENDHCYLYKWSRGKKGVTDVQKISFYDLPERVLDTTDNPYRGLVGRLQYLGLLGRSDSDFSQFVVAEALLKYNVVDWDSISLQATERSFTRAIREAKFFLMSKKAQGLPGTSQDPYLRGRQALTCESVFLP